MPLCLPMNISWKLNKNCSLSTFTLLRKYFLCEFLSIPLGEKNQEMVDLEIIQPCREAWAPTLAKAKRDLSGPFITRSICQLVLPSPYSGFYWNWKISPEPKLPEEMCKKINMFCSVSTSLPRRNSNEGNKVSGLDILLFSMTGKTPDNSKCSTLFAIWQGINNWMVT